jgi:hypothetical protein
MTDTSSKIMTDALAGEIVQQTRLHINLSQEAIVITEDKVRLCLIAHLGRLEARKDWIAPSGILLTLVVTFATTTFRDSLLSAATWQAIFVVSTVLTVAWLARAIWRAWNAPTVEDVVGSMKRAGVAAAGQPTPQSGADA